MLSEAVRKLLEESVSLPFSEETSHFEPKYLIRILLLDAASHEFQFDVGLVDCLLCYRHHFLFLFTHVKGVLMHMGGLLDRGPSHLDDCEKLVWVLSHREVLDRFELLALHRVLGIDDRDRFVRLPADKTAWHRDLGAPTASYHLLGECALQVDRKQLSLIERAVHEDSVVTILARKEDHPSVVGPKGFLDHQVNLVDKLGEPYWALLVG